MKGWTRTMHTPKYRPIKLVIALIPMMAISSLARAEWSFTRLNPEGSGALGLGVQGSTQVGTWSTGWPNHACLWRGNPGTLVDLHPSGAYYSIANAVWGQWQGGYADFDTVP